MKVQIIARFLVICALLNLALKAAAQDHIQELADLWSDAYNSFDEKALGDLYTKAAYLYIHGAPMVVGREPIREFWAEDFAIENPKTILKVTHSVEGFDMMLVHGYYEVIDRGSSESLGSGRFAHIWHNVDGEWLLDQDLWNQPWEE